MGQTGLILVGAVLFLNGLVTLGIVPGRSAAVLNLFVGAAQVVLPTIILAQAAGDPAIVSATWPSYLFGFTYLYYGFNLIFELDPRGLGWFSSFVAAVAVVQAALSVRTDPAFAVVWLVWAAMWTLFFLLLGLGIQAPTRFTGWFLVWLGIPSTVVPAVLQLAGTWPADASGGLVALVAAVVLTLVAAAFTRSRVVRDDGEGVTAPDTVALSLEG